MGTGSEGNGPPQRGAGWCPPPVRVAAAPGGGPRASPGHPVQRWRAAEPVGLRARGKGLGEGKAPALLPRSAHPARGVLAAPLGPPLSTWGPRPSTYPRGSSLYSPLLWPPRHSKTANRETNASGVFRQRFRNLPMLYVVICGPASLTHASDMPVFSQPLSSSRFHGPLPLPPQSAPSTSRALVAISHRDTSLPSGPTLTRERRASKEAARTTGFKGQGSGRGRALHMNQERWLGHEGRF